MKGVKKRTRGPESLMLTANHHSGIDLGDKCNYDIRK